MLLSGRGDNPIGPKSTSKLVFLSGWGEYKCGQQLVSVCQEKLYIRHQRQTCAESFRQLTTRFGRCMGVRMTNESRLQSSRLEFNP